LKVGDVVTFVNGTAITSPKDLARAIGTLPAGDEANVNIVRQGKKAELQVKLGDRTKLEKQRRS
jgi:serine protease Do